MNKKELKRQYIAHCENTAPDMEKLWERIESGLEEKQESRVTSKPVKLVKSVGFKRAAAWCTTCAAVLIAIPAFIIGSNNMKTASDLAESQNAAFAGDMADGTFAAEETAFEGFTESPAEEEAVVDYADLTAALPEKVYYENLSFAHADEAEAETPSPTAEPFGDEFFAEEKVLAETDIIVDAVLQDVVYSSGGDTVVYVLSDAEDSEHNILGRISVESASRYLLQLGREYILPLKETEDGYRLVFENAPQIERTLDGGVVFHNGWKCLSGNSAEVVYPQNGIDDFFYDRMRFSYIDGMTAVTDKWKEIKNNEKDE